MAARWVEKAAWAAWADWAPGLRALRSSALGLKVAQAGTAEVASCTCETRTPRGICGDLDLLDMKQAIGHTRRRRPIHMGSLPNVERAPGGAVRRVFAQSRKDCAHNRTTQQ